MNDATSAYGLWSLVVVNSAVFILFALPEFYRVNDQVPTAMSISDKITKYLVVSVLAAGVGALVWKLFAPSGTNSAYRVSVRVPDLSPLALTGRSAFDAFCATCHGPNASGTDRGPPLIHDIYKSDHHADEAFYRAAQRGVRRHHWRYGDMPPQPQVSREQMAAVVCYVRELQAANGITDHTGCS